MIGPQVLTPTTVILAKHSQPVVDPATPATTWGLSTVGRRRALALAASARHRGPARVFSSPETKAVETAEIVAASLRLEIEVIDELREHERPSLPFAASRDAFERSIHESFQHPDQAIHGGESVKEARRRFDGAIERLLGSHPGKTPLIVTHGTVLAAYVAGVTGQDAFSLWLGLDLPSWLALDLDARAIVAQWRVVSRAEPFTG